MVERWYGGFMDYWGGASLYFGDNRLWWTGVGFTFWWLLNANWGEGGTRGGFWAILLWVDDAGLSA